MSDEPEFQDGVRRLSEKRVEPPFDGSDPCPACPSSVRGLSAVAHNLVAADPRKGGDPARFWRKFEELKRAVEAFQPVLDAHFANRAHSHGGTG